MESLFHGASVENMSVHKDGFTIRSGGQELNAVVLAPTSSNLSLDPDVVKLANITDNPIKPSGRITLTTETRNGAAFSAILMSSDLKFSGITRDNQGSIGAILEGGYILVNPGHGKIMNGPLGTDGILTAYTPDGTMLVVEGTHGSINGNTIVHADTPVTVLVEGMRISFTATSTTRIHVRTEQRVRRVLLTGRKSKTGVATTEPVWYQQPFWKEMALLHLKSEKHLPYCCLSV